MDNPNPIYYRDLISPDNSILNLIQQLTTLLDKYEEMKGKIQNSAAEAAKSMQNLSGATEEQRQQIQLLTTESEKLTKAYEQTNNAERETYRRRQQVIAAVKEEQRVDKLLVEINNSAEGSYNRLSAQYRLNKIRLNEMSAEQRKNTEAGRQLEKETRLIYEEMSRLQQETGKYTLEVGHYQNALKGLPGPIGQVVSGFTNMKTQLNAIGSSSLPIAQKGLQGFTTVLSGTIGLIMIFVRQLTGSAKLLREFEQANANLATILGTTRDEMSILTQSALTLGRTTRYTASQVTELQTELAKLGFSQGSILSMQESVLNFATAVGTNLADAASVAGATLRAFNLTSADTEKVLAVLAVGANKSALSFDRIQQSIGTVFPVANAFGVSVEDTTALLGALANAGFDASSAATATRNILLNLADANGKLAKAIGRPVRTLDEMIDGFIALRKSGLNLADALDLTDKRSVAAFSAFLSGAESTRALREELNGVDEELRRIAEERANTTQGAVDRLKSAWDGLILSFQESNNMIRDTIEWLTKLIGKIQELLFPVSTFQSAEAEQFTKEFQRFYADRGADDAKSYIEGFIETQEKFAEEAEKKAGQGALLNRLFGLNRDAKSRRAAANAAKEAGQAVLSQIENDLKEQQRQREIAAEEELENQKRRNEELSKEQKKAIEAAKKQRIADLRAVVEAINMEIAITDAGTDKMLALRLEKLDAQQRLEIEQNRQKVESERQDEAKIQAKFDKEREDAIKDFNAEVSKLNVQRLQAEQQALQMQIQITEDGTEELLNLRLALIEKQREIEIEQNRVKDEKVRQDEKLINAKYDRMALKESADFNTKLAQRDLEAMQDLAEAEFDLLDRNERQKTIFRLNLEKARLEAILKINETATNKMTDMEVKAVKAAIEKINQEKNRVGYDNLYELLGLNVSDRQQDALNTAISSISDSIGSLIDSWVSAADAAADSANKQVDAAQKILDAEIEARNAGYANNVDVAKKELELAKQNAREAEKERQKAQKAQARIDALTQSSSLVTASANIWASLSSVPLIGPALAVAAIAAMWTSFAAAKIKASQVSKEEYGEGTVELLRGGSHASGHDIDLGRKSDGTQRRAEGGEFFAVINRRNSRRYRNVIPDVINSFNDGTFAERYRKANEKMSGMAIGMIGGGTDVSGLEKDVRAIRQQGDQSRYTDADGNQIVRYKNVTRKIYKS